MDNIDYQTYEITKGVEQEVPIPHTDGCGMVLPSISSKNFMIRMPWFKGLLGVWDFKKFCEEHGCRIVTDIWGNVWDIFDDDIQVIFTKSQMKMNNKYFTTWEMYKENFKKYGCEAGICNIEEDDIPDAQINYQMLQTLHDMTDDEIEELCSHANNKIKHLSSNLKNALEFYRVKVNKDKHFEPIDKNNWFEKGLSLYPELIKDPATQQDLKDKKNSYVKRYRAGKLDVSGKFTFVLPDLYAFCEWLFMGIKTPEGLIEDGEVYCRLYPTIKELDCLRSPHLAMEHQVKTNIYGKKRRGINLDDYFKTDAVYISTKDLISRVLMLDVDGDRLLVVADQFIVNIAKRNLNEVYPLYYELHKAKIHTVTKEAIYDGLEAAFKGGKIGAISNDITKIWAEEKITEQEKDCIKLLVFENNAVIDMAKTLWKPERPKQVDKLIKTYTRKKVPYFFRYAKDKTFSKDSKKSQTEKCGTGVIDRITKTIKDKRIMLSSIKNLGDIDYRYMLSDFNHDVVNEKVNKLFNHHNRFYGYNIRYDDRDKDNNNINYICQIVKQEIAEIEPDTVKVVDSLITMMYKKPTTRKKNLLWILYGDIICSNLENNLDSSNICIDCGRRVNYDLVLGKCKTCRPDASNNEIKEKEIICCDCHKRIIVPSNSRKIRCDECASEKRKETYRRSTQKYKENLKNQQVIL